MLGVSACRTMSGLLSLKHVLSINQDAEACFSVVGESATNPGYAMNKHTRKGDACGGGRVGGGLAEQLFCCRCACTDIGWLDDLTWWCMCSSAYEWEAVTCLFVSPCRVVRSRYGTYAYAASAICHIWPLSSDSLFYLRSTV